jgi:uncharacterized membrane protein
VSTAHLPKHAFRISRLPAAQPLDWLRLGWEDLRANPGIGIGYGIAVAALGWLLVYLTMVVDRFYLVPLLFVGFLFIAPLLSTGLMAVARERERSGHGDARAALRSLKINGPSLGIMGVFLALVFLNWLMLSNLLFGSLFHEVLPTYERVRPLPVMFMQSLPFIAAFGGLALVLALLVFRLTALSLPMLVDRKVDAFNASFASWHAVGENWPAMTVWAALIFALTAIGFATFFVALIVVVPLLGYATWHAYRDTLVAQPAEGSDSEPASPAA